jgi:hypothetical protein
MHRLVRPLGSVLFVFSLVLLYANPASAQSELKAFLYNPSRSRAVLTYPYAKPPETLEYKTILFFEGKEIPDGTHKLSYTVRSGGRTLRQGDINITAKDNQFRAEAALDKPYPEADAVDWRIETGGSQPIVGQSPLRYSRFRGRVRYRDPQLHQAAYINLISTFWDQPGDIYVPVDEDGSFDAMVPARVYAIVNVNSLGYSYNTMERWAWDYDLTRSREDEFTIGRTEIYGMRAFNIPAGMLRTVVVLFRPSALTRILHFDADRDGLVQGEERKKTAEAMKQSSTAIAPVLAAGDIKAWFNGESVPVVQVTHVPEYDGGGVWQSQYVVQLSLPAGVAVHPWNEVRIEVESTEELNGKKIVDWGQGSVGFSYAR